MDYYNIPQEPATHYECLMGVDEISVKDILKEQAFQAMDKLEGWCSKQKASVLIDLVRFKKPKIVVEIGVFGGKSLVPMAFAVRENGYGKVYGIDPWDKLSSTEGMDGVNYEWWNSIDHLKILNGLKARIHEFNLDDQIELIQATSEDAEPIGPISLLHIDGNHSEKTSFIDVTKWVPLVEKGGLVIFDDVNWSTTKSAVEWLDNNCIRFSQFSGDNIWGIWVKP